MKQIGPLVEKLYAIKVRRLLMKDPVHSLIHIYEDALLFGSLDNISAFPSENCFANVKKISAGSEVTS